MIKVFWHETELGKGGLERQKKNRQEKMPKVFQRPLLSDARKCFGGANYKSSSAARTATAKLSAHESRRLTAQQQRSSFLALALVVLSSS